MLRRVTLFQDSDQLLSHLLQKLIGLVCAVTSIRQRQQCEWMNLHDLAQLSQLVQRWAFQVDRKSTRLNSSHVAISYAVFCLKKKNNEYIRTNHDNTWISYHL